MQRSFHTTISSLRRRPAPSAPFMTQDISSILQSNKQNVNKILKVQKEQAQKTKKHQQQEKENVQKSEEEFEEGTFFPSNKTKREEEKPLPGEIEVNLLDIKGDYSHYEGVFPNSPDEIDDALARKINLLFPNNKLVSDEESNMQSMMKRLAAFNAGYHVATPDFKIYWRDIFKKNPNATKEESCVYELVKKTVDTLEACYQTKIETLDYEDDNFESYIREADKEHTNAPFYEFFKLNFDISKEDRKEEEESLKLGYKKLENMHFLYTFDSPFTTEVFPSTFDAIQMEDETLHFDFPESEKKRSEPEEESKEKPE